MATVRRCATEPREADPITTKDRSMTLSPLDREFLAGLVPWERRDLSEREFGELVDAWYAQDHFDNNPVYSSEPEAQR